VELPSGFIHQVSVGRRCTGCMMTVELTEALLRRDTPLFPVRHCKKVTAKPKIERQQHGTG
jgi:hypothetical protein